MTTGLKRNAIVHSKEEEKNGWILYGRIWKVLKDGRLVVVCGGSHVKIYQPDELVLSDYKGCIRKGRFVHMDSLKRLKWYASQYNPYFSHNNNVWGSKWTKAKRKEALKRLDMGKLYWDKDESVS